MKIRGSPLHLRVRGFKTVRFCATIKALGINIRRITTSIKAGVVPVQPVKDRKSVLKTLIFVFKDRFSPFLANLRIKLIRAEKMLAA